MEGSFNDCGPLQSPDNESEWLGAVSFHNLTAFNGEIVQRVTQTQVVVGFTFKSQQRTIIQKHEVTVSPILYVLTC